MGLMEIVLIIIGIVAFVLGFFLPGDRKGSSQSQVRIDEEDIRNVVEKEMEEARSQLGDIVDETITYAMEKTERSMDRLTNEKMLAVNEYSDTVLGEINKSHKEVVFLYDMLNDKHESLKATVSEAIRTDSEIRQVSRDAEITAREMQERVRAVEETVNEALSGRQVMSEPGGAARSAAVKQEPVRDPDGFTPFTARSMEEAAAEKIIPEVEPVEKSKSPARKRTSSKKASGQMEEIILPAGEDAAGEKEAVQRDRTSAREAFAQERMSDQGERSALDLPGGDRGQEDPASGETGDDGGKNSNDRILQLHKAGKSNMAIARELGLGLGEVKLVIDLFEGV